MTARTHDLAAVTALGVVVLAQPLRTVTLATAIIAVFANLIGGITTSRRRRFGGICR
jgi:hypothetical protein